MTAKKLQARARVRITLDIYPSSPWGQDCSVEQVYKQGKDSALATLRNILSGLDHRAKLVGEPIIEAIIKPENN